MSKHKQEPVVGLSDIGIGLDEMIRRGARRGRTSTSMVFSASSRRAP